MKKYEFVNYFWGFRARMHYNAAILRKSTTSQLEYNIRREIKVFADGLSWMPNFSNEDYKKFIRVANKYLDMVARGEINPRFNDYGE